MMKFSRTFASAALITALCTATCTAFAAPDAGGAAIATASATTTAAVPAFDLDADVNRALKTFGVPGMAIAIVKDGKVVTACLLYTSPSPRDRQKSRMPSSA